MLELEKDGIYEALRVRSGTSVKGDWELIVVKADGRGRQKITIFPDNKPSGVKEGGKLIVKEIHSVTVKATKNADGTFGADVTTVSATVKPCADIDGVDDLDDFSDTDLEL